MKRMVQEMINEVEVYESETPASEELYSKLELKVRKKFNDEIDRLEKSFRISDQKADLTTQVKNMELYASENNFNIFYEKKRRELKSLQ